jgi:hypothetical protein
VLAAIPGWHSRPTVQRVLHGHGTVLVSSPETPTTRPPLWAAFFCAGSPAASRSCADAILFLPPKGVESTQHPSSMHCGKVITVRPPSGQINPAPTCAHGFRDCNVRHITVTRRFRVAGFLVAASDRTPKPAAGSERTSLVVAVFHSAALSWQPSLRGLGVR